MLQGDFDGLFIQKLHTHVLPGGLGGRLFVGIGLFPGGGVQSVALVIQVSFRILDEEQHVGVVRGHVGIQGLLPRRTRSHRR